MRLRGMLFDLDGTLGDTVPVCIQAFQRTFHHYLGQHVTAQDIVAMFGPSTEYERAHATCRDVFSGLLPLLATLRARGVRLGIVTGKGLRSAQISARVLGLDAYFEGIEAGAADGPIKPAGMQAFLRRWAVAPQTVAYVGDAPYDMDAARQAEVIAVAAAWATGANAETLAARQPHVVFQRVADFVAWAERVSQ